jgi:hypothetical protein
MSRGAHTGASIGQVTKSKARSSGVDDAWLANNRYLVDAPPPPSGGNCTGKPTEWWFNSHVPAQHMLGRQISLEEREAALELCRTCAIRTECLRYSLEWEPYGMWGAFNETQRDLIRDAFGVMLRRTGRTHARVTGGMPLSNWISDQGDLEFLTSIAPPRRQVK